MGRGGKRIGAGRPAGQGRFGERTKAMRIPESLTHSVLEFISNKGYKLPLFSSTVRAGSPTVADEHIESKLDLNELLVRHPGATFFVRVSGDSMIDAGINNNDILIVDRNLEPTHGKIVVAAIDGQLTVKRLEKKAERVYLMPANKEFTPIEVKSDNHVCIWGVVTNVIHAV